MAFISKKRKTAETKLEKNKSYSLKEASSLVKQVNTTKFDASVDLHIRLGVVTKIEGGWVDIDVIVATPSVMPKIGKLGKILGPRNLMPNPKTGTVTNDVAAAVREVKGGKIAFKIDKAGIIHASIGRVSFTPEKIAENSQELLNAIIKAKPSSAKGVYLKGISMASSMSPGIAVDTKAFVH